jgi:hypothetical protein
VPTCIPCPPGSSLHVPLGEPTCHPPIHIHWKLSVSRCQNNKSRQCSKGEIGLIKCKMKEKWILQEWLCPQNSTSQQFFPLFAAELHWCIIKDNQVRKACEISNLWGAFYSYDSVSRELQIMLAILKPCLHLQTLWSLVTKSHYNHTNADVLQNVVSEKKIKTSTFNDTLCPHEPLLVTQRFLYHILQLIAQTYLTRLSWYQCSKFCKSTWVW